MKTLIIWASVTAFLTGYGNGIEIAEVEQGQQVISPNDDGMADSLALRVKTRIEATKEIKDKKKEYKEKIRQWLEYDLTISDSAGTIIDEVISVQDIPNDFFNSAGLDDDDLLPIPEFSLKWEGFIDGIAASDGAYNYSVIVKYWREKLPGKNQARIVGESEPWLGQFIVDITPPEIFINSINTPTTETENEIAGVVSEPGDLELFINGEPIAVIYDHPGGEFNFDSQYFIEGVNSIEIHATDWGFNKAVATTSVIVDLTAPAISLDEVASPTSSLAFHLTGTVEDLTKTTADVYLNSSLVIQSMPLPDGIVDASDISLVEGANNIVLLVTDELGWQSEIDLTVIRDTTPPIVDIYFPFYNPETRTESVSCVINLTDETEVSSDTLRILLNGGEATRYFSGSISQLISTFDWPMLNDGENELVIEVEDELGNATIENKKFSFKKFEGYQVVGPDGGTISITDEYSPLKGVILTIPPGALDQPTPIEISRQNSLHPYPKAELIGPIVVLSPIGLRFNIPVRLTLPYDLQKLTAPTVVEPIVNVYQVEPVTNQPLAIEVVERDLEEKNVTVESSHFSVYVAGAPLSPAGDWSEPIALIDGILMKKASDGGEMGLVGRDFTFGPDDQIYIIEESTVDGQRIVRINNQGLRTIISTGSNVPKGFMTLSDIIYDPQTDFLFVTDLGAEGEFPGDGRVIKIALDGNTAQVVADELDEPWSIDIKPADGKILILDIGTDSTPPTIYEMAPYSPYDLNIFAIPPSFPFDVAFTGSLDQGVNGDIYFSLNVADISNNPQGRVYRYDELSQEFYAVSESLPDPFSITCDKLGLFHPDYGPGSLFVSTGAWADWVYTDSERTQSGNIYFIGGQAWSSQGIATGFTGIKSAEFATDGSLFVLDLFTSDLYQMYNYSHWFDRFATQITQAELPQECRDSALSFLRSIEESVDRTRITEKIYNKLIGLGVILAECGAESEPDTLNNLLGELLGFTERTIDTVPPEITFGDTSKTGYYTHRPVISAYYYDENIDIDSLQVLLNGEDVTHLFVNIDRNHATSGDLWLKEGVNHIEARISDIYGNVGYTNYSALVLDALKIFLSAAERDVTITDPRSDIAGASVTRPGNSLLPGDFVLISETVVPDQFNYNADTPIGQPILFDAENASEPNDFLITIPFDPNKFLFEFNEHNRHYPDQIKVIYYNYADPPSSPSLIIEPVLVDLENFTVTIRTDLKGVFQVIAENPYRLIPTGEVVELPYFMILSRDDHQFNLPYLYQSPDRIPKVYIDQLSSSAFPRTCKHSEYQYCLMAELWPNHRDNGYAIGESDGVVDVIGNQAIGNHWVSQDPADDNRIAIEIIPPAADWTSLPLDLTLSFTDNYGLSSASLNVNMELVSEKIDLPPGSYFHISEIIFPPQGGSVNILDSNRGVETTQDSILIKGCYDPNPDLSKPLGEQTCDNAENFYEQLDLVFYDPNKMEILGVHQFMPGNVTSWTEFDPNESRNKNINFAMTLNIPNSMRDFVFLKLEKEGAASEPLALFTLKKQMQKRFDHYATVGTRAEPLLFAAVVNQDDAQILPVVDTADFYLGPYSFGGYYTNSPGGQLEFDWFTPPINPIELTAAYYGPYTPPENFGFFDYASLDYSVKQSSDSIPEYGFYSIDLTETPAGYVVFKFASLDSFNRPILFFKTLYHSPTVPDIELRPSADGDYVFGWADSPDCHPSHPDECFNPSIYLYNANLPLSGLKIDYHSTYWQTAEPPLSHSQTFTPALGHGLITPTLSFGFTSESPQKILQPFFFDTSPPVIDLDAPAQTAAIRLQAEGSISDDFFEEAYIDFNGRGWRKFGIASINGGTFAIDEFLVPGLNLVTIVAVDSGGNVGFLKKTIDFTTSYDWAPTIDAVQTFENMFTISGVFNKEICQDPDAQLFIIVRAVNSDKEYYYTLDLTEICAGQAAASAVWGEASAPGQMLSYSTDADNLDPDAGYEIIVYAASAAGGSASSAPVVDWTKPPGDYLVDQIEWEPFSGVKAFVYGNGVKAEIARGEDIYGQADNLRGAISGVRHTRLDGTVLLHYDYRYDAMGNIVKIEDRVANDFDGDYDQSYTYDSQGRLTEAELGLTASGVVERKIKYSYDPLGNRKNTIFYENEVKVKTEGYGYTAKNRLNKRRNWENGSPVADLERDYFMTNDSMGRPEEINKDESLDHLRLRAYYPPGQGLFDRVLGELDNADQVSYLYDYQNLRRRKEINNGGLYYNHHYYYDLEGKLISEYITTGASYVDSIIDYVWLDGMNVAMIVTDPSTGEEDTYYVHNDHLKTPRKLTDSDAAVVWQGRQDPFGKVEVDPASTVECNIRFPGQYFDSETGFHYNWNRYYDPELGRYLTPDPIGLAGGLNQYAYVGSNPVNYSDPEGLSWIEFIRDQGLLLIYPGDESTYGPPAAFPAGNNADSRSRGPWEPGRFPFSYWKPHPESGANQSYGTHGNFIFDVPGCIGCGVHSGRRDSCSTGDRCGVNYPTMGCIRTTDEGTGFLADIFNSDPIQFIDVK